jgi:hypothetical protein
MHPIVAASLGRERRGLGDHSEKCEDRIGCLAGEDGNVVQDVRTKQTVTLPYLHI